MIPIADQGSVALHTPAALTEADAAARLGLKVATLRAWRHRGRGPAFVRLGRAVRYLSNRPRRVPARPTGTHRALSRSTCLIIDKSLAEERR